MPLTASTSHITSQTAITRLALLLAAAAWITGCNQTSSPSTQRQPKPDTQAVASDDHKHDDHAHDDHEEDEHAHDDHDHDHGHDPHKHNEHGDTASVTAPKDLSEAIAQLKKLAVNIEQALSEKKTEVADDLVHTAGHLIDNLHKQIDAAGLKQKAQATATAAAEALFDAYDRLDTALHGAEEELKKLNFADYAPSLEEATATLEGLLQKAEKVIISTPAESTPAEAQPPKTPEPTPGD